MKPIVLVDFSKQSDDELITNTEHIINSMKDNLNYPSPIPAVDVIITLKVEFSNAVVSAKFGGINLTAAKNQKRKALEEALKTLGLYVQINCKNDVSILLSSGFTAKKDPEPIGILAKPANFRVEQGPNAGSLKLSLDAIKGANVYIYQMTNAPVTDQSKWEIKVGKRNIIFNGLTQGKEYAFKVAGKGAVDEEVYSDVITHFVA
jgi:hypothetical protein